MKELHLQTLRIAVSVSGWGFFFQWYLFSQKDTGPKKFKLKDYLKQGPVTLYGY